MAWKHERPIPRGDGASWEGRGRALSADVVDHEAPLADVGGDAQAVGHDHVEEVLAVVELRGVELELPAGGADAREARVEVGQIEVRPRQVFGGVAHRM